MWRDEIREVFRRSSLLLAYLVLVVAMLVGFLMMERLADRIEVEGKVRANENCEQSNETRKAIVAILETLAEPRVEDGPGESERRVEQAETLIELIPQLDCPPSPLDTQ